MPIDPTVIVDAGGLIGAVLLAAAAGAIVARLFIRASSDGSRTGPPPARAPGDREPR